MAERRRHLAADGCDGKSQTIQIDPLEVDELARYLHQAKRVSGKQGGEA